MPNSYEVIINVNVPGIGQRTTTISPLAANTLEEAIAAAKTQLTPIISATSARQLP